VLHFAAKVGNIVVLKTLLSYGGDFTIKDYSNETCLFVACLHSNYECARLLKALHWAKDKDKALMGRIVSQNAAERRKIFAQLMQFKLRELETEKAYGECLLKKKLTPVTFHSTSTPLYGELNDKFVCADSKLQKMFISHNQVQRNIECIGKPNKFPVYVNSKKHNHQNSSTNKSHTSKQTRCKSAPVGRSSRLGKRCTKKISSAGNSTERSTPGKIMPSNLCTENKDQLHHNNGDTGDFASCSAENLIFHDVGRENDLRLLISPGGDDPMNLLQVLRSPSKSFHRSHSDKLHLNYHQSYSLGTINEGELLTTYDRVDSQMFDENFLSSLMPFAFKTSSTYSESLQQYGHSADTVSSKDLIPLSTKVESNSKLMTSPRKDAHQ
jgi:hypothetical protein